MSSRNRASTIASKRGDESASPTTEKVVCHARRPEVLALADDGARAEFFDLYAALIDRELVEFLANESTVKWHASLTATPYTSIVYRRMATSDQSDDSAWGTAGEVPPAL